MADLLDEFDSEYGGKSTDLLDEFDAAYGKSKPKEERGILSRLFGKPDRGEVAPSAEEQERQLREEQLRNARNLGKAQSVLDLPGQQVKPSGAPQAPRRNTPVEELWDSATEEQRRLIEARDDEIGERARQRAAQAQALDATPITGVAREFDTRAEARAARLVSAGEDSRFALRAAQEGARSGVVPGREVQALQRRAGALQESNFDFDTKAIFDPGAEGNGLNNAAVRGLAKGGLGLTKAAVGYMEFLADATGLDASRKAMKDAGQWARGKEAAIGERADALSRNFEGAVSSIAQQLPLLVGGAIKGAQAIPLAGMALTSFGQEYSDGRAAGQSVAQAATRASIFAAFEVIGERFGLGEQLKALRGAARGMPTDQIVALFGQALRKEIPGELLTTTGQFVTDKWAPGGVGLDPKASFEDYTRRVADTILQTVMQSGLMGAGTTGASKAVRFMRDREGQASARSLYEQAEFAKEQALQRWGNLFGAPAGSDAASADPGAAVGGPLTRRPGRGEKEEPEERQTVFSDPNGPASQAGITPISVPLPSGPAAPQSDQAPAIATREQEEQAPAGVEVTELTPEEADALLRDGTAAPTERPAQTQGPVEQPRPRATDPMEDLGDESLPTEDGAVTPGETPDFSDAMERLRQRRVEEGQDEAALGPAPVPERGAQEQPAAAPEQAQEPAQQAQATQVPTSPDQAAGEATTRLAEAMPSEAETGAESATAERLAGRSGAGFSTQGSAKTALRAQQQKRPDLDWTVVERGDGRFELEGQQRDAVATEEPAGKAAAPVWKPSEAERIGIAAAVQAEVNAKSRGASEFAIAQARPDQITEAGREAERVAAAFGLPVVFVTATDTRGRGKMGGSKTTFNGREVILLNVDSPKAPLAVTAHELTHALPPHLKGPVLQAVREVLPPEFRTKVRAKAAVYGGLSDSKADEELAAILMEDVSKDSGFWERVFSRLPDGVVRQLFEAISTKLGSVFGAAGVSVAGHKLPLADAQKIRAAVSDAFAKWAEERAGSSAAQRRAESDTDRKAQREAEAIPGLEVREAFLPDMPDAASGAGADSAAPTSAKRASIKGKVDFSVDGDEESVIDKDSNTVRSVMNIERREREMADASRLSAEERPAIKASAAKIGVQPEVIEEAIREKKKSFPTAGGAWAPITYVRSKKKKSGAIEHVFKTLPYTFDKNKTTGKALKLGSPAYKARVRGVALALVGKVAEVKKRADAGDNNAKVIIEQAGWYRMMRERLRREFGGLGDLFADLLGATSPITAVRTNWGDAIEALRLALQGKYDHLVPQWEEHFARVDALEAEALEWFRREAKELGSKKAVKETDEYKRWRERLSIARELPDRLLPRKESGKRFGANSKNVARALAGLWRVVKAENVDIGRGATAPKAINFSGNLIGFSDRATIDLWAARLLQHLAGMPQIPTVAEGSVAGKMKPDGSTVGQFRFAQDVFQEAARTIRSDSELAESEKLRDINDDDLQALVWFLEKERWTTNNWTNAAGEGGSFEHEASLTGSSKQDRIAKLREIISSSPPAEITAPLRKLDGNAAAAAIAAHAEAHSAELEELRRINAGEVKATKKRKRDLEKATEPPKEHALTLERIARAQEKLAAFEAKKEAAKSELASLERPVDRFVFGLTTEQSMALQGVDYVPTDQDMARLANAIKLAAHEGDKSKALIAVKTATTQGRYGSVERALDTEIVAREGYDPTNVWRTVLEEARAADQDSVFASRILRADEDVDPTRHRPGIEVYFRKSIPKEQLEDILAKLSDSGLTMFTVSVSARPSSASMRGEMPDAVGVRFQYVPEFLQRYGDADFTGMSDEQIVAAMNAKEVELTDLAERLLANNDFVSSAGVYWHDTTAAFRGEYDERIKDLSASGQAEGDSEEAGPGRFQVGESIREGAARAARWNAAREEHARAQAGGSGPLHDRVDGGTSFSLEEAAPGPAEPSVRPDNRGSGGNGAKGERVTGIHYGRAQGLTRLAGTSFGTGIKGAEQERLSKPGVDPRIKKRVYFYVSTPGGIPAPEAGLGPNVYRAELGGLYDWSKASLRDVNAIEARARQIAGDRQNALESAVLDLGYRGIVSDGVAIVLNEDVPVTYIGKKHEHNVVPRNQERVRRVDLENRTREEGDELVRKVGDGYKTIIAARPELAREVPSFRQEFGEARVAKSDADRANEILAKHGGFRFEIDDTSFSIDRDSDLHEAPRALRDDDPLIEVPTLLLTRTPDGNPRELLHGKIISSHFDGVKPANGTPVAYVMGGGGGSGKGAVLKRLVASGKVSEDNAVHLDPDEIKGMIPEYKAIVAAGDSRAAATAHAESSLLTRRVLERALDGKYNIILDSTLGDVGKGLEQLRRMKSAGYVVRLFGVTVDPEIAAERAHDRAKKSGRYVPVDQLLLAHKRFTPAFKQYADIADSAELIDNTTEPTVIAEKSSSGLNIINREEYDKAVARSENVNTEARTINEIYSRGQAESSAREGVGRLDERELERNRGVGTGRTKAPDGARQGLGREASEDGGVSFSVQDDFSKEKDSFGREFITGEPKAKDGFRSSDLKSRSAKSKAAEELVTKAFDDQFPAINVARRVGLNDPAAHNFVLELESLSGRIVDRTDKADAALVAPLQKALGDASKRLRMGVPAMVDAYGLYRLAMHAQERNATLRERGSKKVSPSGMSDQEARTWLKFFKSQPPLLAEMRKLDPLLKAIQEETDRVLMGAGLLTQEEINARADWQWYVNLAGDPTLGEDGSDAFVSASWNDDTLKGAKGRNSLSVNPLVNTLNALQAAINNAEYATVKAALYNFAKAHPKALGAEVKGIGAQPMYDANGNLVYFKPTEDKFNPNAIVYRKGKHQWVIKLADRAVADAIKRPPQKAAMRPLRIATRMLAQMLTRFSPTFPMVNVIRDIQQQLTLMLGDTITDANGNKVSSAAIAAKMAGRYHRTFSAALKEAFGKAPTGKYSAAAKELKRLGGVSGFSRLFNDAEALKDFVREAEKASGQNTKAKVWDGFIDFIDNINETFELTGRVAAFSTLTELGVDPKAAANITKNLLNFDKAGTMTRNGWMGAAYMFIRPAMTDFRKNMQLLKTPKGAAMIMLGTVLSAAAYAMLREASGDDDDDPEIKKMDKHSAALRRNYIILPFGGDTPVRVPVGYGPPRIMWGLGVSLVDAVSNKHMTQPEVAEGIVRSFTSAISPFNFSDVSPVDSPKEWAALSFTPSVLQPLAQHMLNLNNFGSRIRKNENAAGVDAAFTSFSRTPEFLRQLSRDVYEATGLSVSPETWAHYVNGYLGGVGRMALQSAVLYEKVGTGQDIQLRDYPALSTFVMARERYVESQFRKVIEAAEAANKARITAESGASQRADAKAMTEGNARMVAIYKDIQNMRRHEAEAIKKAQAIKDPKERNARLDEIDTISRQYKADFVETWEMIRSGDQ